MFNKIYVIVHGNCLFDKANLCACVYCGYYCWECSESNEANTFKLLNYIHNANRNEKVDVKCGLLSAECTECARCTLTCILQFMSFIVFVLIFFWFSFFYCSILCDIEFYFIDAHTAYKQNQRIVIIINCICWKSFLLSSVMRARVFIVGAVVECSRTTKFISNV